jgi:hypothetical protein
MKLTDILSDIILNESIKDGVVTCDKCAWQWNMADGGTDTYTCHKCGHDNTPVNEDLRKWFKEKWVNIGKKVNGKHPPCGTSGEKKGYAKCVPAAKAATMSKKEKESATERKRKAQNAAGRGGKDSAGQGKAPINVSTKPKNESWSQKYKNSIDCSHPKGFSQKAHCAGKKKNEEMNLEEKLNLFLERNCPNDPGKWSASKALAKSKFDVYPSAYGNAFAAKNYKSKGGTWKKCNEGEMNALCEDCWDGYKQVGGKIKNGKQVPNCVPINEEEVSPEHQREMIEGIAEIVRGVKDITNRKELAKKQIKQLKSEGIEFDVKEFLSMCGFKSGLKEGADISDRGSYLESESEEIERTSDDLDIPYDDIRDSLMNGKEITLDDKMWSRLENTDSYHIKDKEEAIKLANNYGKDWKSIEDAEETPPALILQYEPNKYYLVGGNTRLMFAKANKTNPKVILGTIEPLNKYAYQDVNDIGADLTEEYDVENNQYLNELRQGLLNYLKQQLPNFPDYVIKDWVYRFNKEGSAEGIQDWIDTQLKDLKWETKTNFPITMDILGDKTKKELKSRVGGEIRQDVGKDIERHKTQQNLLKSQGISKEPIILFKTKDGKYELGEGWHRTIQAFKMYPEGFIQPNVYICLNAKWLDENEEIDEYDVETIQEFQDFKQFIREYATMINEAEGITEAEYHGRKVKLGKPFLTPDGPKKRSVYVKNPAGRVVKVNFGDPNMKIKKNIPSHRKSFRARHHCDTNPGPRTKARYWSCRAW